MSTFVWLLALAALAPLLWLLLKLGIAWTVPHKISGEALLKQTMKKNGIQYESFPDAFFKESVELVDEVSKNMGYGSTVKTKAEFVSGIETFADIVRLWRTNPNDNMFKQWGDKPNFYRRLFEKHNI